MSKLAIVSCQFNYKNRQFNGVAVSPGVNSELVDTCFEGKKAMVFPNAAQKDLPGLTGITAIGEQSVKPEGYLLLIPEVV